MVSDAHVCRACCSSISREAGLCPFCRTPQSVQGYAGLYAPGLIFLATVLSMFAWMDSKVDGLWKQPKFYEHAESLTIGESRFAYASDDSRPRLTAFGVVRNSSDIPWSDLVVEIRYFDDTGQLIDATTSETYGLYVPPRGEAAFRVQTSPAREEAAYARHEVAVKNARYGDSLL